MIGLNINVIGYDMSTTAIESGTLGNDSEHRPALSLVMSPPDADVCITGSPSLDPTGATELGATVVPEDPYVAMAHAAIEFALADGRPSRDLRIGPILGAVFGRDEIPRNVRHSFFDVFNAQPGVNFRGQGLYRISRVVSPEPGDTTKEDYDVSLDTLATAVVDRIKPGWPFGEGTFFGCAKTILGRRLSSYETDLLMALVVVDPRISVRQDGSFDRRDDGIKPTPRDELALQPEVPDEIVITRATLDGLIKTGLSQRYGRKPRPHQKHSGWRRSSDMNGYVQE